MTRCLTKSKIKWIAFFVIFVTFVILNEIIMIGISNLLGEDVCINYTSYDFTL